jgi:hypothetical protein
LRAARANRLFGTEIKRVRTKKTVMDENNCELGLFQSEIADPRGRDAVHASFIAADRCAVLRRSMPAYGNAS